MQWTGVYIITHSKQLIESAGIIIKETALVRIIKRVSISLKVIEMIKTFDRSKKCKNESDCPILSKLIKSLIDLSQP